MEKYLHTCLDSLELADRNLANQLEILIINDGSKDSSSEIAHKYEEKSPLMFRVIDKENGNYGSCINRGLKEAVGKYVKVLDADDYFINDSLSIFIEFLGGIDADLVISPYVKVNENKEILNDIKFNLPKKTNIKVSEKCIESVFYSKHFQMHAVTYKTKIFKTLNYKQSEGISYTDQEWMFLPITKVDEIAYFPKTLYCYLLGREGQTMDVKSQIRQVDHHMQGTIKMLKEYTCGEKVSHQEKYLVHRLNRRVSEIYKICLLYRISYDKLYNFDKEVKEINSLYYNQLDNMVIHK